MAWSSPGSQDFAVHSFNLPVNCDPKIFNEKFQKQTIPKLGTARHPRSVMKSLTILLRPAQA